MSSTENDTNSVIKLKDGKEVLKENHKNEIKMNRLVNGTSKEMGSISKKKNKKDVNIDKNEPRSEEKLNHVHISSLDSKCKYKLSNGLDSNDICNVEKTKFDSNDILMHLKKTNNDVDYSANIKLDIARKLSCFSCDEDALSTKLANLDLDNADNKLQTICKNNLIEDMCLLKEGLVSKSENLDISPIKSNCKNSLEFEKPVKYVQYVNELQMPLIMKIIQKDLSEPYSIYTYRYFIHNWPKFCFLAMDDDKCVGAIVCKLDLHRKVVKRGYIAMLAVDKDYRNQGIGSTLVKKAIQEMIIGDADEVVLETEVTNRPALRLYEALGFVRDKRLFRYYLNGVDALRLKLWLR